MGSLTIIDSNFTLQLHVFETTACHSILSIAHVCEQCTEQIKIDWSRSRLEVENARYKMTPLYGQTFSIKTISITEQDER